MLGSLRDRLLRGSNKKPRTSPVVRFQEVETLPEGSSIRGAFLVDSVGLILFGGSCGGVLKNAWPVGLSIRKLFGDANAKALDSALTRRSRNGSQVEEAVHLNGCTFTLIATPLQLDHEPFFNLVLALRSGDPTADEDQGDVGSPLSDKKECCHKGQKQHTFPEDERLSNSGLSPCSARSRSKSPKAQTADPGRVSSDNSLAYSASARSFSSWSFDKEFADKEVQTDQVPVSCQAEGGLKDLPASPVGTAKPPLPPFADRAEDAARATAHALAVERRLRARRPLEGVWSVLSNHEYKVEDALLRLHFQRGDVVLDNLGTQHLLQKSGQKLTLAGFVVSLEGWNVLHLDQEDERLSYTRGEGAYPIGKPVERTRPSADTGSQQRLESKITSSPSTQVSDQREDELQNLLPQRVNSIAELDLSQLMDELDDLEQDLEAHSTRPSYGLHAPH